MSTASDSAAEGAASTAGTQPATDAVAAPDTAAAAAAAAPDGAGGGAGASAGAASAGSVGVGSDASASGSGTQLSSKTKESAAASGVIDDDTALADELGKLTLDLETIRQLEQYYNQLIKAHPTTIGKALSSKERDEKKLTKSTLVYGEIKFDSFAIAFEKIKNKYGGLKKPGGKFYDIGSGTGKPAFAAALLHDFDSVTGIEILEGLYTASLELLEVWNTEIVPKLSDNKKKTKITFLNDDVTRRDWSDADCWFANSTCFDETLMSKLATIADKMKVGTFCVTFTRRLPSAKWQVLEHQVYTMSWGNATVYIQKKIHL